MVGAAAAVVHRRHAAPALGHNADMSDAAPRYKTIEDTIGNTPLVQLVRVSGEATASAAT